MNPASLCVIGAGRAGGSLARAWHHHEVFNIRSICTRTPRAELASALNTESCGHPQDLPSSDLLQISTGDNAIATVASELATSSIRQWQGTVVFHLSGSLPSSCLHELAAKGAYVASAHPVKAFATDTTSLHDCFVGLEGDSRALAVLQPAFESIGTKCFHIDSSKKREYHAAAVIASNHLVALADAADTVWKDSGLTPDTSNALFASLVSGVLENLQQHAPAAALTGPIARGDNDTLQTHLDALDQSLPAQAELYRQNSRYLVDMMADRHGEALTQQMHQVLLKNATAE